MAYVQTYNSLVTDLQNTTERSDATYINEIPNIISRAESRIARELKPRGFERYLAGNFTVGDQGSVLLKPERWRDTVSFNFGTGPDLNSYTQLYFRPYEFCRQYWPNSFSTGQPAYYADYGPTAWLIVPSPDKAYPFEAVIYQRLAPLDVNNQTNWLTDFAPDLLFSACMVESSPFLKVPDQLQVWQQIYQVASAALTGNEMWKLVDRTNSSTTGLNPQGVPA